MSESKKWSLKRALMWGAGLGLIYSVVSLFFRGGSGAILSPYGTGYLLGGAVAAAVLFGIVCLIRNLLKK